MVAECQRPLYHQYSVKKNGCIDTAQGQSSAEEKVHKHMCHSESTADRYYMKGEHTRQALESHAILRKNMGLDDENSGNNVQQHKEQEEGQDERTK